jgi:hypothetical protein
VGRHALAAEGCDGVQRAGNLEGVLKDMKGVGEP